MLKLFVISLIFILAVSFSAISFSKNAVAKQITKNTVAKQITKNGKTKLKGDPHEMGKKKHKK